MHRLLLFVMGLTLLGAACTPGLAESVPSSSNGNAAPTATAALAPKTVVGKAEAIIGERFSGTGYIESIVSIEYVGQAIRLTMDRSTFTLGNLEAFSKMCQALTGLIGSDGPTGQVVGVQTFRADGSPVVVGTKRGEPCAPPSP